MTPEDTNKIVAAIDRNTEATREVAVSGLVRNIILFCAFVLAFTEVGCPRAKATPLLPPLTYEIGTPPLPPPNPHVQYWHTQWVPGPDGVLPVEVFAPRLVAANSPIGHPGPVGPTGPVDMPEPGTLGMVISFVIGMPIGWWGYARLRTALDRRRARKALEESK